AQQPSFLTKHLNVWVKSDHTWLDMQKFLACADPNLKESDFADLDSVIGLDLASKLDILAGMKVFYKDIDGKRHYYVFGDYWLPEEQIMAAANGHYKGWYQGGWLHMSAGGTNDYDEVEDWIRENCKRYKVKAIPHDQYQAVEMCNHLLEEK